MWRKKYYKNLAWNATDRIRPILFHIRTNSRHHVTVARLTDFARVLNLKLWRHNADKCALWWWFFLVTALCHRNASGGSWGLLVGKKGRGPNGWKLRNPSFFRSWCIGIFMVIGILQDDNTSTLTPRNMWRWRRDHKGPGLQEGQSQTKKDEFPRR